MSAAVASAAADASGPSRRSLRGLDWLNFFLADVQNGVGPFLAIYLASAGWREQTIGIALTGGGIASILAQTPAGALADRVYSKRGLIAGAVIALATGALLIAIRPTFWAIMMAQCLIGVSSSVFGPTVVAISLGIVGRDLFDRRQGHNQTFHSAGNVVAAIAMGAIGYFLTNRAIFFFVMAFSIQTLRALAAIRADDINTKWHEEPMAKLSPAGCERAGNPDSSK